MAELINKDSNFATSGLISSYAWDTALNFICQTNVEGYILATTLNRKYGNIMQDIQTVHVNTGMYSADKYSNIYDIIGNAYEWTTEYCNIKDEPCTFRGNSKMSEGFAANRYKHDIEYYSKYIGFRTQLYIK